MDNVLRTCDSVITLVYCSPSDFSTAYLEVQKSLGSAKYNFYGAGHLVTAYFVQPYLLLHVKS